MFEIGKKPFTAKSQRTLSLSPFSGFKAQSVENTPFGATLSAKLPPNMGDWSRNLMIGRHSMYMLNGLVRIRQI
ncbi:MAG: hypothetical protein C4B58_09495 [Deltaproteobacteria bacterium]|nr:MAG: hypothetical protein C4B58_09495 [Deltaproteobacteria bacterium]